MVSAAALSIARGGGGRRVVAACIRRAVAQKHWKNAAVAQQFQWVHSHTAKDTEISETSVPSPTASSDKKEPVVWATLNQHPNYKLRYYYETKHPDLTYDVDACHSRTLRERKNEKGGWWTVTFTCPLTKREFPAGTLEEVQPRMHVGNTVYYKKVRHAVMAASARAVDCIYFEETKITAPRHCAEEPIVVEAKQEEQQPLAEDVAVEQEVTVLSSPHGPNEVEVFSQEAEVPEQHPRTRLGVTAYTSGDDDEDLDDEYTIHHISSPPVDGKTSMDRILKAWAKSVNSTSSERQDTKSHCTLPLTHQIHPLDQHQATIDAAVRWYKAAKDHHAGKKNRKSTFTRTQFNPPSSFLSVDAAVSILTALSKINQDWNGSSLVTKARVEPLANGIVRLLWDRHRDSVSTDVYNVYFRCFSGTDEEVARRADDLLSKMSSGEQVDGHVLPKPNIETYNTVFQLWGRVGRQLAHDNIRKNFNVMTNIPQKNDKGSNETLVPNRETFLSILASMATGWNTGDPHDVPTSFGKDTQLWISRAETCSKSLADESLRPDAEMYNAPLRHSSGVHGPSWSRRIPWDRHAEIFAKGFKVQPPHVGDDELTIEARQMEEWLYAMEKSQDNSVSPSIETYESVIQAWVRTGTKDGLLQAESLAMRLIASLIAPDTTVSPRLQTFHPILAGWAFSGDETGPEKIKEWIERLEEQSKTTPQVRPDGRIKSLPVTAWRTRTQRLVEAAGTSKVSSDVDEDTSESNTQTPHKDKDAVMNEILTAAQACSSELESLCNVLRQVRLEQSHPEFFMESSVFEQVIEAWGDVASFLFSDTNRHNDFTHHNATVQILHTVKQLDDTIEFYKSFEKPGADAEWHSRQLNHLLHNAPQVYMAAIGFLNDMSLDAPTKPGANSSLLSVNKQSMFSRNLAWVETMLRKSMIHHHTLLKTRSVSYSSDFSLEDDSSVSPSDTCDSIVTYSDMYSYRNVKSNLAATPQSMPIILEFFNQVAIGCNGLSPDLESGDAIRLCMLMLDFLQDYSSSEPRTADVDATELYSSISSVFGSKVSTSVARTILLQRLHSHVSSKQNVRKVQTSSVDGVEGDTEGTVDDDSASEKLVVNKGKILSAIENMMETGSETADKPRDSSSNPRKAVRVAGKRRRPRGKRKPRKKNSK